MAKLCIPCTVYSKKYAHGFVVLCFVVVMQSFIMNSHEVFIHIHQGCFAGTGAIVRLPQCQWSKPDGYGKISQCITTTKHSKAKTVCIFLGIYCMYTTDNWKFYYRQTSNISRTFVSNKFVDHSDVVEVSCMFLMILKKGPWQFHRQRPEHFLWHTLQYSYLFIAHYHRRMRSIYIYIHIVELSVILSYAVSGTCYIFNPYRRYSIFTLMFTYVCPAIWC